MNRSWHHGDDDRADHRGRARRERPVPDPLEREVDRQLAPLDSSPDFTPAVMQRLGFTPCSPAAAQRHRRRGWLKRATLVLGAWLIVGLAIEVYSKGPRVRLPSGPTVPGALHHDFARQSQRIDRTIQSIRNFSPGAERKRTSQPPAAPRIDHSAISPVRWV